MGKHDFTHFANVSEANQNPVKTITRFDVIVDDDGYVFQVEGHGFLYKMVCLHFALLASLSLYTCRLVNAVTELNSTVHVC